MEELKMGTKSIEICANLLQRANNVVVLTGAGISTESGIKDFRSQTGIYKLAPEYILSLNYFYAHPEDFYQFAVENLYHPDAVPNKGHQILAKWEKEGKVKQIITQNIDGLHQKAGSQNVIEFHGTIKTAACLNCGMRYTTEDMITRLHSMDEFYVCNHCVTKEKRERYIKPDVVLFGDSGKWFSTQGFNHILNLMNQADCVLVLGTSLKVTPFSTFPQYRRNGVPLIIINKGDTPYDMKPDTYVIWDSIGEVMSDLNRNL